MEILGQKREDLIRKDKAQISERFDAHEVGVTNTVVAVDEKFDSFV